jgi:hypothetical protein
MSFCQRQLSLSLDRDAAFHAALLFRNWMSFWLLGFEDPDHAKAERYRRWENLCDMQLAQNPHHPAFCVHTQRH